jgi:hypothetical protein
MILVLLRGIMKTIVYLARAVMLVCHLVRLTNFLVQRSSDRDISL